MGGEVPERQRRQGNESVASSVRMRSLYLKREAGGLHTPRAREWPRVGMRGESEGERAGGPTPSGSPPAETSRATEPVGSQPRGGCGIPEANQLGGQRDSTSYREAAGLPRTQSGRVVPWSGTRGHAWPRRHSPRGGVASPSTGSRAQEVWRPRGP